MWTLAFFVFMQDAVLEPFGGDPFGLPVAETTRFNAFWGSGVLLGMVRTMLFTRRWRPDQQVGTTMWGLGLLAIPLIALGGSAWTANLAPVRPVLVLFGIGFGIFTVGGRQPPDGNERRGSGGGLPSPVDCHPAGEPRGRDRGRRNLARRGAGADRELRKHLWDRVLVGGDRSVSLCLAFEAGGCARLRSKA
ncbi:MAG: PucC family protein [Chloroflexi bacterium]|nr:PucC family protein [Chloroflexota bacterium]